MRTSNLEIHRISVSHSINDSIGTMEQLKYFKSFIQVDIFCFQIFSIRNHSTVRPSIFTYQYVRKIYHICGKKQDWCIWHLEDIRLYLYISWLINLSNNTIHQWNITIFEASKQSYLYMIYSVLSVLWEFFAGFEYKYLIWRDYYIIYR